MEHYFVLDLARPFIVFNDDGTLTMEPVTGDDLEPIKLCEGSFGASCAWSSGCQFYFIITDAGIAMLDLNGDGFFCKKRSAMFFDLFLNAPMPKKKRGIRPVRRDEAA